MRKTTTTTREYDSAGNVTKETVVEVTGDSYTWPVYPKPVMPHHPPIYGPYYVRPVTHIY